MKSASFAARAAPDHKAVARMVGYTLHLGRDSHLGPYWGLAVVLRSKLTAGERQGLAWAALIATDDDEAEGIAAAVLEAQGGAGAPLPPFLSEADEAAWWASHASPRELRAYGAACAARLVTMPGRRRA